MEPIDPKPVELFPPEVRFETAEEFLDFLRLSNDRWWGPNGVPYLGDNDWVFRGHPDDTWKLIPGGLRPLNEKCESHREKFRVQLHNQLKKYIPANQNECDSQISLYLSAIMESIHQFVRLARSRGFPVNILTQSPLSNQTLYDQIVDITLDDLNNAALAQHHGIDTHLLDWSESPLAAAYFASRRDRTTDIAVWALDKKTVQDRKHPDYSKFYLAFGGNPMQLSLANNPYLAAQKGLLTGRLLQGADCGFDRVNNRWLGSEEILLRQFPDGVPVLRKIVLSRSAVPRLRLLLQREGITKDGLMPSLDNIVKSVYQNFIQL